MGKHVPTGTKRDSAANAYRAGSRNHARWCTHGRVSGAGPTRVELLVDGCGPGNSSHKKEWTVRADQDWPVTLAEMCEFASASATGELTPRARASCQRARDIRPESLLALARYGKQNRMWKALEAIVEADPKFAPAVIEDLSRMEYSGGQRQAFWDRVGVLAKGARQSSAVQLLVYSRVASIYGWKISLEPYPTFFVWVRNHPYLNAAWLALASGLARGNPSDYPDSENPPLTADGFPLPMARKDYPPNEATHTASLTLSLAIYRNWPQSYRSLWMIWATRSSVTGGCSAGRTSGAMYRPSASAASP